MYLFIGVMRKLARDPVRRIVDVVVVKIAGRINVELVGVGAIEVVGGQESPSR